MNRDTLKQIMVDQKDIYLNNPLIERHYPLEENINYCFVGIRRCGKSYMMYQQIQTLLEKKIPLSQIVYVNFEDERLLEMTADDLNTILEIGLELSGAGNKPYLFLDEIQNIDGWEKFVRRIADMKYRISITGSNSKMLSSEIASTLGGRFVIMNIYPYSFTEFLIANGKEKNYLDTISTSDKADLLSQYNEYVTYGAFPELVEIKNKRTFLSSIYQTVYLGDITKSGTQLDAVVSRELIGNIFYYGSPLHDGAVVIRDGRVVAAGCVLPLSQKEIFDSQLGTRHRAAIGMSEQSDAMVVVTSEESGTISIAFKGSLTRNVTDSELRERLVRYLCSDQQGDKSAQKGIRKLFGGLKK